MLLNIINTNASIIYGTKQKPVRIHPTRGRTYIGRVEVVGVWQWQIHDNKTIHLYSVNVTAGASTTSRGHDDDVI